MELNEALTSRLETPPERQPVVTILGDLQSGYLASADLQRALGEENERIVRALPIMFRRLRRETLSDDELQQLIELLGGAWRSERPGG